MQQHEQEQQEHERRPTMARQPGQSSEPDSTSAPAQQDQPAGVENVERAEQQQAEGQPVGAEQQKAEEYLDLLQRTQADFMNYRRRAGKEQAEGRVAAQSGLLSHLLPVLDDLELALRAAPAEMAHHPWVQGLFLVARRLQGQLDQLGVQRVGIPGEAFDPNKHEAVATEARADVPEGMIAHVVQPGYVLGERVIRPAQVSVAGTPASTGDAPAQPEGSAPQ